MILFKDLLLFASYISISAAGLLLMKLAGGKFFSMQAITGIGLYGIGFIMWFFILARIPLSVAFPIAAGSLILASLFLGKLILKEDISTIHIIGCVFVITGIGLIANGMRT
jgi:multidrug transporter EmrE-like cation transporter